MRDRHCWFPLTRPVYPQDYNGSAAQVVAVLTLRSFAVHTSIFDKDLRHQWPRFINEDGVGAFCAAARWC